MKKTLQVDKKSALPRPTRGYPHEHVFGSQGVIELEFQVLYLDFDVG